MNIQDISKDLLASVSSIIEKKNVKEVDEPKAKGEKDFKDLHTKNVKVHTEKKKNECTSEKDFKPHMMYDPKTGKGYEAKTYDDHVRMDKMGYTHEKPEVKEVDEPTAKGEKDFKDLHTKNVKVHTESIEEATGKEIAAKMMKDKMLKPFASKVAKMKSVTAKDLDKMLPDYIAGGDISSLFEGADKDVKGDKEAYQKFFQGMLKKFGVKSPAELSGDKEREFYDAIDAGWKADDEKKESIDEVRDMKIKNGKVYISKKDFVKVHKDFKNTEKGKERMSVLDPVTKGTVSMSVVFEDVELDKESIEEEISLDEGMKYVNKTTGKDITKHVIDLLSGKIDKKQFEKLVGVTPKKESIEEMKEPFIVVDTADDNKVVGTASDEKGAERIISSSERPPISIKDKKTLKIVKSNKKQNVGFPLKEAATNAFYRTTRIHLALRNAGLKPNDAKKVTDALKIIYGGGSEYKGSEVENVVRAVIGDSMGRKLAAKTIEQLHDLSRSVTQKWGFNEAKSATGYEIYHKDFSTAMQHAYDFAKKKYGITVDPEEIMTNVAMGPRKPSKGKTNSYRLKGDKGTIQVQVYGMDSGKYELNMYKEGVATNDELTISEATQTLNEATEIYVGKGYKIIRYAAGAGKTSISILKDGSRSDYVDVSLDEFEMIVDVFKKLGNKASSVLKNAKDMKIQEPITEAVRSMDPKKRLKIFNDLKKGDKVQIAYDTPIAKADIYKDGELIYREFTVTRNKTVVGKARVEKITLAKDNVKSGVKFFLYNRDGSVSFAIGDMASVIVDMKKM